MGGSWRSTSLTIQICSGPVGEARAATSGSTSGSPSGYPRSAAVLGTFDRLVQNAPAKLNAVAVAQAVPVDAAGRARRSRVLAGSVHRAQSELEAFVAPLIGAA